MNKLKIRIDATDVKAYEGKPTDFFLCHSPLIEDTPGHEAEYVLQNEWPFILSQVLKFPDEASAEKFMTIPANAYTPCLRVRNVVLRMSGALAKVTAPYTTLTPQEVGELSINIFPKAGHWYRLAVMEKEVPHQQDKPNSTES